MVNTIYQITLVCDNAAVTAKLFSKASQEVLANLKRSYAFLVFGIDESGAFKTINHIFKLAHSISKASYELNGDFHKAERSVRDTLEETHTIAGSLKK